MCIKNIFKTIFRDRYKDFLIAQQEIVQLMDDSRKKNEEYLTSSFEYQKNLDAHYEQISFLLGQIKDESVVDFVYSIMEIIHLIQVQNINMHKNTVELVNTHMKIFTCSVKADLFQKN